MRVNVLCDYQQMGYDQTNPNLFALWDGFHIVRYPDIAANETNNVVGREGDKFIARLPFQLETASVNGVIPLLKSISMSIVAVKSGETDFVVESQNFDISQACTSNGQQIPNISVSRGYQSAPNDPFNTVSLTTNKNYNSRGTKKGYLFNYAFTLRYDSWNSIAATTPGFGNCTNINNDIPTVNNRWGLLQQNGWGLVLRLNANVQGYDGYLTPYQTQTTVTVYPITALASKGPNYVISTAFYDINNNQVASIQSGTKTKISFTFTPDGTSIPSNYDGYSVVAWADIYGQGGVTNRRFASTDIPVESGSPFSAAAKNGSPVTFYNTGGLSLNVYSTAVVIAETYYDDTVTNWSQKTLNIILAANISLKDTGLETDGGVDIKTDGGKFIKP